MPPIGTGPIGGFGSPEKDHLAVLVLQQYSAVLHLCQKPEPEIGNSDLSCYTVAEAPGIERQVFTPGAKFPFVLTTGKPGYR